MAVVGLCLMASMLIGCGHGGDITKTPLKRDPVKSDFSEGGGTIIGNPENKKVMMDGVVYLFSVEIDCSKKGYIIENGIQILCPPK